MKNKMKNKFSDKEVEKSFKDLKSENNKKYTLEFTQNKLNLFNSTNLNLKFDMVDGNYFYLILILLKIIYLIFRFKKRKKICAHYLGLCYRTTLEFLLLLIYEDSN